MLLMVKRSGTDLRVLLQGLRALRGKIREPSLLPSPGRKTGGRTSTVIQVEDACAFGTGSGVANEDFGQSGCMMECKLKIPCLPGFSSLGKFASGRFFPVEIIGETARIQSSTMMYDVFKHLGMQPKLADAGKLKHSLCGRLRCLNMDHTRSYEEHIPDQRASAYLCESTDISSMLCGVPDELYHCSAILQGQHVLVDWSSASGTCNHSTTRAIGQWSRP